MSPDENLSPSVKQALGLLGAADPVVGEDFVQAVLARTQTGMESQGSQPNIQKLVRAQGISRQWSRSASVTASSIGLLVVIALFLGRNELKRIITLQPSTVAFKEYRTAAGERARFALSDGSTIVLGPDSRVRYAVDLSTTKSRTIILDGQALFTVTHAAGSPFIVRSGDIETRVLGTSFAVRRYATDSAVQVVVAQGRVAVGATVLGTGDVATAIAPEAVSVARAQAVTEQLAWAEGRLVFSGISLRDAIPDLERWYGIKITVKDSALLSRPIITTLDTETASEAVQVIAGIVEGRGKLSGNLAIIQER